MKWLCVQKASKLEEVAENEHLWIQASLKKHADKQGKMHYWGCLHVRRDQSGGKISRKEIFSSILVIFKCMRVHSVFFFMEKREKWSFSEELKAGETYSFRVHLMDASWITRGWIGDVRFGRFFFHVKT